MVVDLHLFSVWQLWWPGEPSIYLARRLWPFLSNMDLEAHHLCQYIFKEAVICFNKLGLTFESCLDTSAGADCNSLHSNATVLSNRMLQ